MAKSSASEPYYLGKKAPRRLPMTVAEERLKPVLASGARSAVAETVKRWNVGLREAVRATTALKLSGDSGRAAASVPVSVADGMPQPLAEATSDVEQWQWWLILFAPALAEARDGLGVIAGQRAMLADHLGDIGDEMDSVESSRRFVERILGHSIERTLAERLEAIEDDILGAYWVHDSKIQIYWMPIAIFASLFGLPIRTLTIITLCHELAHAYTHRGVDLNSNAWNTDHFVRTDNEVKEGLAQYYTDHVMRAFETRVPGILDAFLKLAESQSRLYSDYQNWIGNSEESGLEAVRYAMLELRNSSPPLYDYEGFVENIRSAQRVLGGVRPAPGIQGTLFG